MRKMLHFTLDKILDVFSYLWYLWGRSLRWLRAKLKLIAPILLFGGMVGCNTLPNPPAIDIDNSLPGVHSGIDRASAHIEIATGLVEAAKPHSDPTGVTLLDLTAEQHTHALTELDNARAQTARAETERDEFADAVAERDTAILARDARIRKVEGGWGFKLQQFVTRFLWILAIATTAHFILGAVALFIPGPIGAGLALVGRLLNPASWFQTIRDKMWRRKVPA